MASDQTLRAIITVLDRTAEPIHQINARFEAMGAPLREISSRVSELAEEVGLKRIGEHAKKAFEQVRHLGEAVLEIAGPLAALGAAGSVAGLVEMAKSTAEFAEQLDIGAGMTGIATETLSGWHYAAGLVNVDVQQLDKGFTYLNRNINEAAAGKAKDVQTILTRMGLTNAPGHLVNTGDALKAVAAEVKHLVDGGHIQLATDMMSKLFGARQGAQLMPLFEQGPEGLKKALGEAAEAGISLTSAQTRSGHEFMDQYKAMSASVDGLKVAIGNELLPALTPILEGMRDWLNANREWIATKIGESVKYFSERIKEIDWKAIGHDLHEIGAGAALVVDKLGGIGPAIGVVAAISLAPEIAAFMQLGGAVAGVAAKFVVFPVAELLVSFATLVPAIESFRDVWVALDVAMDANPLGVAVLAVAALGVAAYELYEHWNQVEGFFEDLWNSLPGWAKTGVQIIGASIAPFIAIPAEIYAHWSDLKGFFTTLLADIASIFESAYKRIEPIVRSIEHPLDWIGQKLGMDHSASPSAEDFRHRHDPLRLGVQPPLSTLPGAAAAAGAALANGPQGQTKVTVDFLNLPPARVSTESRGSADPPQINIGEAMVPG
jgi:hypothetical protein